MSANPNSARHTDPNPLPPSSARTVRRSRSGSTSSAGGGGESRGDHEARLSALEQEHQDTRDLMQRIAEQQESILVTLGAEPQPLLDRPGSGLLGVVSTLHSERDEWQRNRLRFWRVVAGASALLGLASALGPRIAAIFH